MYTGEPTPKGQGNAVDTDLAAVLAVLVAVLILIGVLGLVLIAVLILVLVIHVRFLRKFVLAALPLP